MGRLDFITIILLSYISLFIPYDKYQRMDKILFERTTTNQRVTIRFPRLFEFQSRRKKLFVCYFVFQRVVFGPEREKRDSRHSPGVSGTITDLLTRIAGSDNEISNYQ